MMHGVGKSNFVPLYVVEYSGTNYSLVIYQIDGKEIADSA